MSRFEPNLVEPAMTLEAYHRQNGSPPNGVTQSDPPLPPDDPEPLDGVAAPEVPPAPPAPPERPCEVCSKPLKDSQARACSPQCARRLGGRASAVRTAQKVVSHPRGKIVGSGPPPIVRQDVAAAPGVQVVVPGGMGSTGTSTCTVGDLPALLDALPELVISVRLAGLEKWELHRG